MRSVDAKTAWERYSDTKSLRIITGVSTWCQSQGGAASKGGSFVRWAARRMLYFTIDTGRSRACSINFATRSLISSRVSRTASIP
jgi:hypothetical protein